MRKLTAFNFITLNGYYKGANGDISWHVHNAHNQDTEESNLAEKGANSGNILLFGRVTYQMMASYWPTRQAIASSPVVAEGMNKADKIVFSKTLQKADWNNTILINGNLVEEVRKLKQQQGNNITILGSGSVITQLAEAGLIDEYQFMVDPVAIGRGTPIFHNINHPLNLKLTQAKTFKSGAVVLSYQAV
ncbi:dihydrofolate reductase family protein [Mucilaginibacter sabulilitoris]|uniref:Dihydrofolate reductase family protein n=1 Tax=Mucilaginibacter sabulilitoris TaxID=1173583 RepID=A0ABZ0TP57_9SPHI|nr:dihydrofolate reductase family protein [Mucilaginibacter sabulilitoris]WPU94237.1 dihydrofolate reductase family protein [Mucilaginibacter sabulilitoris]